MTGLQFCFQSGHDRYAIYTNGDNISHEVVPSDVSTESDSDDILVLDEVRNSNPAVPAAAVVEAAAIAPTPGTSAAAFPSTSRGIVISSDDEVNGPADDVEIVGVVKPRHLRTPVIVSLSSDDEAGAGGGARVGIKNEESPTLDNDPEFTINISDSEDEIPAPIIPAPIIPSPDAGNSASGANRWSGSSEDEMLGRRREKGKGKGKKTKQQQQQKSTSVQNTSPLPTATSAPATATVAASANWPQPESSRLTSEFVSAVPSSSSSSGGMSSTAVKEAEEQLLSAWKSRMAARMR